MKLKNIFCLGLLASISMTSSVFASNTAIVTSDTVVTDTEDNVSKNLMADSLILVDDYEDGHFVLDENQYIDVDSVVVIDANAKTNKDTTLYIEPDSGTEELMSVDEGEEVSVISVYKGEYNDWNQVSVNGEEGYILSRDLDGDLVDFVEEKEIFDDMELSVGTANKSTYIYDDTIIDAAKLIPVIKGDEVDVLEESDNWYKVEYSDITGYIEKKYIDDVEIKVDEAESKAEEIISYGEKFLGTPYRSGGTNLSSGVDCSGFVSSVFGDNGISLNRSSRSMVNNGTYVSKSELEAGDIVLFDTSGSNNGSISHVAIYIGDGQILHSSTSQGVSICSMYDSYWSGKYVTARRVL